MLAASLIVGPMSAFADTPVLGLAYQPYVGQWSQRPDNPHAPGHFHVPAFNSYAGGIDALDPARSLLAATQTIRLTFDDAGRLQGIEADGSLAFRPETLLGQGAEPWSRNHFRFLADPAPQPTRHIDHAASVYRQLDHLRRAAAGAPLTLATYGTGFQSNYWRRIGEHDYATLPVWTDSQTVHVHGQGAPNRTRQVEPVLFHFPPTATHVRPAAAGVQIETSGQAGQDLTLLAVHQTLFEPARASDPTARLNPGFFAGDANAQIALAAAEINAQAGRPLVTIKLGVSNILVDGTLLNDRMRFSILSALAQAWVANRRFPGTVSHLIISNEYAQPQGDADRRPTPTEQVTELIRYARSRIRPDGDFAGLALRIGARGNRFRLADASSPDPAIRRFGQDVAALIGEADFLMENLYPSPEAVEAAAQTGHWEVYFEPERGELANQWRQLRQTINGLARGRPIELMIGEIGHPTNGIAFNLPGYVEDGTPIRPGTALARVADAIETHPPRLGQAGIDHFQRYFNERLASAFVREAVAWSRAMGVQIHLFEAFDEPWKATPNLPPDEPASVRALLGRSGAYGAEGFYGLFGYTGVADQQSARHRPADIRPGSRLVARLPTGMDWAGPFDGRFFAKLPQIDFAELAHSFSPVSP